MRYAFIREQQKAYPVTVLCKVMMVSRSGYYDYFRAKPSMRLLLQQKLLIEVKAIATESRHSCGKRTIAKHLQAKGYVVGVYATNAKHVLNRQFQVEKQNRAWVGDITYLWTLEGWLYVAAVLDLFSRRIVGWAMAEHMKESLVSDALRMALGRRNPEPGLLQHTNRGVQYASHAYQTLLKNSGMIVSMSRKGNCWDNAVMERFWGSLKSERTDGQIYLSRSDAKKDVVDYMEVYYNNKRLHSSLGYVSPVQFEMNNS
jgi:putative transposase